VLLLLRSAHLLYLLRVLVLRSARLLCLLRLMLLLLSQMLLLLLLRMFTSPLWIGTSLCPSLSRPLSMSRTLLLRAV
jgi:hypothetical protein